MTCITCKRFTPPVRLKYLRGQRGCESQHLINRNRIWKKILKPFSSESKSCSHLNVWTKAGIPGVTKVFADHLNIIGWEFFKDLVGNFGKEQRRKVKWLLSQLGCQEARNFGVLVRIKRVSCKRFGRNGLRTRLGIRRMGHLLTVDSQGAGLDRREVRYHTPHSTWRQK